MQHMPQQAVQQAQTLQNQVFQCPTMGMFGGTMGQITPAAQQAMQSMAMQNMAAAANMVGVQMVGPFPMGGGYGPGMHIPETGRQAPMGAPNVPLRMLGHRC